MEGDGQFDAGLCVATSQYWLCRIEGFFNVAGGSCKISFIGPYFLSISSSGDVLSPGDFLMAR